MKEETEKSAEIAESDYQSKSNKVFCDAKRN